MIRPRAAALAAALLACACASVTGEGAPGTILDARRERACTFEEMVDDLATVRMVFVGESHTNPEHHELQRRILEALSLRRPRLMVGLEMIQRPYQEVLDAWSAGDMEESAFLREANWYGQWSDWDLYGPILRLARDRRIRVVGLNVDRAITREIGRVGLDGLPAWMRTSIPADIDLSVKPHRKAIREIFFSHPGMEDAEDRFKRFYEAQVTWDEVMAESAARALAEGPPDAAIVVLAGAKHVEGFHAIPERARRRSGLPYRVVLPVERDGKGDEPVKLGMGRPADYVVFTSPTPASREVRLGVALRGGDTLVTSVAEGSAAAQAGLREGDVLLAVDDVRIGDTVDIRLALETRGPGDRVRLRWRRDGVEAEGEGTLAAPPNPFAAPPPATK